MSTSDASAPKREPVDLLADEIESFLSPYRCSYHTTLVKILAPYAACLDEIEDLRAALDKYGAHQIQCAQHFTREPCDCGLDEAAMRGEPKEGM
jgi:hypothetical protein